MCIYIYRKMINSCSSHQPAIVVLVNVGLRQQNGPWLRLLLGHKTTATMCWLKDLEYKSSVRNQVKFICSSQFSSSANPPIGRMFYGPNNASFFDQLPHINHQFLTCSESGLLWYFGGFKPSEQYESLGILVPNVWKNIKYLPNHQLALVFWYTFLNCWDVLDATPVKSPASATGLSPSPQQAPDDGDCGGR